MTALPWEPASATGVGSVPGEDIGEALRLVFAELPRLPHLPELPARGPGADLLGRGAGLLLDMPVDLQPAGWRVIGRPGRDARRTADMWARDLDALAEIADGYAGPLKVQVVGPWTLAAGLELGRGDKVLADPSAVADLAASLAEGVAGHVADVRRRVPGAAVVAQVDEPSLPAVVAGRVRTASGFGVLPVPEPRDVVERLSVVLSASTAAGAAAGVHCCAADVPFDLLRQAGASFISVDAAMLRPRDDDAVGESVEAGVRLMLGLVPATDTELPDLATLARPARQLWRRLGFTPERLGEVVVTPACGLAGASPSYARRALAACRELATAVAEKPEAP